MTGESTRASGADAVREGHEEDAALFPEAEAWRWELENPLGARVRVATAAGRPVARFATRPQRVLADGEPRVFACILPPWSAPDAGAAGDGDEPPLETAARRLLEDTAGWEQDALTYGWLPREVFTWCARDLRFELLRVHTVLVGGTGDAGGGLPAGVSEVTELDGRIERLHARAAAAYGVSGMRDPAFLAWRVTHHPKRPYRVLGVAGADGELAGTAILRESAVLGGEGLCLVDWLVPEDDAEAGAALLEGVRVLARDLGRAEVRASLPEWSRWFARFQARGFEVRGSSLRLATRKTHPRHEIYWLRDNWWVQPLDFAGV